MADLNLSLHPGQIEVFNDPHRFKILCTGRRWGKTLLCSRIITVKAVEKPGSVFWIVAPVSSQTGIMWRMLKKFVPKELIANIHETKAVITFKNGSEIYAKSGDDADSLRGEGLDGVILDECAMIKKDVWSQAIRPALTDKHGWAILISTPKSFNWFYDMFTREKTDERYKSFHYTSHDNPFLTEEELEDLAKDMSEDDFRQEIMAVFITTGGSVFKDFREVLKNVSPTPIPNRTYVIGVDIGQTQDFTVISVGDMTAGAQVYLERFNQTDWAYIKERIKVNHLKYNHGIVIFDSTGKGEPLYEDLLKMKVSSYPYRFTNPSKEITVNALRLAISNRTLTLLEDQAQIDELQAYEYRKTAAGATQYGAPSGKHDDIVTAVMLMAWGMEMSCSDTIGEISKEEGKPESPWLDEDDKKWAWDVEEDEPTFDDND